MSDSSASDTETLSLLEYTERAYLDYSMYVINDRALPFIGDGLKPVQRRIIYSMAELRITHDAKPAKSARTIGDVTAKYHPHGEQACYESMVLMSQSFSMRYPLIDGHGNWGAPDEPKSFAASRYTEARLSRWTPLLLDELRQGTVDRVANFDGTLTEPIFLPAKVPFFLLNGGSGIAVGMATDILPHNLREVCQACVALLKRKSTTIDEILDLVPGPDVPTGGDIIASREDIRRLYEDGNGTLRGRARYTKERGLDGGTELVVTQLPYQSSPAKIAEQIAAQINARKLPMVVDIRDESDYENPTRLVMVLRSNRVDVERLMLHLFATTDLERTYRFNLNLIGLDRKPRVKGVREALIEWLNFRRQTVKRRLEFELAAIDRRLHTLAGLLVAYTNLDEVIRIVREEEKAKSVLMEKFDLSGEQADAILDLRLRQLARLEEEALLQEQAELQENKERIELTLSSTKRIDTLIRQELESIAEEYGDDRRTRITQDQEAQAFSAEELTVNEPMTVLLSTKGWVRAAKGHDVDGESLPYRAGDSHLMQVTTRSSEICNFLASDGRVFSVPVRELPSARGQGEPLSGRFNIDAGTSIVGAFSANNTNVLLSTSRGFGFVAPVSTLTATTRNGKQVVVLQDDQVPLKPRVFDDADLVACVSQQGHLLVFSAGDLAVQSRGKGTKLQNIHPGPFAEGTDLMLDVEIVGPKDTLLVHAGKRYLSLSYSELEPYRGKRAARGKDLPKGYRRNIQRLELRHRKSKVAE